MSKAANSYLQTQVATTTPGELLILLYDACVKNLRQAQDRIRERDFRNKGMLISKAIDIISELQASLNAQKGGDLALNLQKLYFYCNTRLLRANMNMDTAIIDEVIKIISGIRDAYNQIITQQPTAGLPPQTAVKSPPAPARASAIEAAAAAAGNRPSAPVVLVAPFAQEAPAAPSAQAVLVAPASVEEAAPETAASQDVFSARGPNHRAFAAYASAHKQGA